MEFLNWLSNNKSVVVILGLTVVAVLIFILFISGKLDDFHFKDDKREINLQSKRRQAKKVAKHAQLPSSIDISLLKDLIISNIEAFEQRIVQADKKYELSIQTGYRTAASRSIDDIMLAYPQNVLESKDLLIKQELLNLYLERDLNKIILNIFDAQQSNLELKTLQEIELNNYVESVVHQILNSLKVRIKDYKIISENRIELERTYDAVAKNLLENLQVAIKNYVAMTDLKLKEEQNLLAERNKTIDEQISRLMNGEVEDAK